MRRLTRAKLTQGVSQPHTADRIKRDIFALREDFLTSLGFAGWMAPLLFANPGARKEESCAGPRSSCFCVTGCPLCLVVLAGMWERKPKGLHCQWRHLLHAFFVRRLRCSAVPLRHHARRSTPELSRGSRHWLLGHSCFHTGARHQPRTGIEREFVSVRLRQPERRGSRFFDQWYERRTRLRIPYFLAPSPNRTTLFGLEAARVGVVL